MLYPCPKPGKSFLWNNGRQIRRSNFNHAQGTLPHLNLEFAAVESL